MKDNYWPCVRYVCTINGKDFDYFLGIGHLKRYQDTGQTYFKPKKIPGTDHVHLGPQPKSSGNGRPPLTLINKEIALHFHPRRCTIYEWEQLENSGCYVEPPKLEHVLNSLFLDSSAHDETFENWCSEFGYDSDSIKARKIYDECNEVFFKTREALGKDFEEIRKHIQSLEI